MKHTNYFFNKWKNRVTMDFQAHAHNQDIKAMNDVDTVVIVMKSPSNIIATLDLSRHASYGYDQRIEVRNVTFSHYCTSPYSSELAVL